MMRKATITIDTDSLSSEMVEAILAAVRAMVKMLDMALGVKVNVEAHDSDTGEAIS